MKQLKKDIVTIIILIGLTLLSLEFVSWVCRMAFENTCIELEEQYLATETDEIAANIENSINFGKTLDNYFGMEDVLAQAAGLSDGGLKAVILNTDGKVLYTSFAEKEPEHVDDLAALYAKEFQEKLMTAADGEKIEAGSKTAMVFPVYERKNNLAGYLCMLYEPQNLIHEEHKVNTQTVLFLILEIVTVLLMLVLTSYSVHKNPKTGQLASSLVMMGGMLCYILFLFVSYRSSYQTLVEQKAQQAAVSVQAEIERLVDKGLDAGQLYRIDHYIEKRVESSQSLQKITIQTGEDRQLQKEAEKGVLYFSSASGRVWMEAEINQDYINEKISLMLITFGAIFAVCLMIAFELTNLAGIISVRISGDFNRKTKSQAAAISAQIRVLSFMAYTASYASMPYAAVIMRSWNASVFGLSAAVSASLPLTVEMVSILAASALIQKVFRGMRPDWLMIFIFPFLILGNAACIRVSSPLLLIGMRAFTGVGTAFLKYWLNNLVAAGSADEESFSLNCGRLNAGLLGGITAGAALGAVTAQAMGYQFNYMFTAAVYVVLSLWALFTMPWKLLVHGEQEGEDKKESSSGSFAGIFENPRILLTLLFGCVPLNIGLMYVVSFIPSYMSSIGQSAAASSYVYLVNGIAGMYLGVFVLNLLKKKSFYISASAALFLAAGGMRCLLISRSLAAVMLSAGILGLFDGFGTPSITSYFTGLSPEHSDTAGMMTIFSIVGSAVQIVCPLLYGMLIQADGKMTYLAMFGAAYLLMAVLFTVTCRPGKGKQEVLHG